jgi:UDP-3-O-[3-hydroxymyristoyl] glucosamine N-acyltransferase
MGAVRTTGSIASMVGAELRGPADIVIERLETLERSGPGSLTFIRSSKYAGGWASCGASAALVSRGVEVAGHDEASRALLVVDDADLALIRVLELFLPEGSSPGAGIDALAVVSAEARVSPSASVGPGCVIGARSSVGEGCVIGPNVVIGTDVSIGAGSVVRAGCVIEDRCAIGRRCSLHAGVVIGADGFGYHPSPDGGGPMKIPHIGDVRIGDDVEIGANSCVDRAKLGSTLIGDATKIDNLVQIGHNCVIGRACLICGHAGLAGSVTLGDGVVIGGGVGIADNVSLGAGSSVAAGSGVMNDVPAGETWGGLPATNMRASAPNYAAFRSLAEYVREIKRLSKRVDRLEGGS